MPRFCMDYAHCENLRIFLGSAVTNFVGTPQALIYILNKF